MPQGFVRWSTVGNGAGREHNGFVKPAVVSINLDPSGGGTNG
jgi:hypothetical protein